MFHHEYVKQYKKGQERDLKEVIKNEKRYNLLEDLIIDWSLSSNKSRYTFNYGRFASLYLCDGEKLQRIGEWLDEVEETILIGWELDIDKCISSTTNHNYVYKKEGEEEIRLEFYNPNCKTIKTGKMIAETITVCNESM